MINDFDTSGLNKRITEEAISKDYSFSQCNKTKKKQKKNKATQTDMYNVSYLIAVIEMYCGSTRIQKTIRPDSEFFLSTKLLLMYVL